MTRVSVTKFTYPHLDSEVIHQNFLLLNKSSFRQIGDFFFFFLRYMQEKKAKMQQERAGDASLKGGPTHPKK